MGTIQIRRLTLQSWIGGDLLPNIILNSEAKKQFSEEQTVNFLSSSVQSDSGTNVKRQKKSNPGERDVLKQICVKTCKTQFFEVTANDREIC